MPQQNATHTASSQSVPPEKFVDADRAASFVCMTRRKLLDWARASLIPAHPWGEGRRHTWRFLLSELEEWGRKQDNSRAPGASKKERLQ